MNEQSYSEESLWYKDAIIYELHIKAFFSIAMATELVILRACCRSWITWKISVSRQFGSFHSTPLLFGMMGMILQIIIRSILPTETWRILKISLRRPMPAD